MDPARLYETVHSIAEHLAEQERFRPEFARAWREFFGVDVEVRRQPERGRPAHTRFCEWFVLERVSEVLGDVPIRRLGELTGDEPAELDALLGSRVGIYRVDAVGDDSARLIDLQTERPEDLRSDPGWRENLKLTAGDLLVGRLYPDDRGRCVPSAAVAVVAAGERLSEALQQDLRASQLPRRLHQAELEHLLFRKWDAARETVQQSRPIEHLEARLETLLRDAGAVRHSATEISRALRDASSAGSVMGPLLDEIAFDTSVDLDELRMLLLEMWNAYHPGGDVIPTPDPATPQPAADGSAKPEDGGGARRTELASGFEPREGESLGETLARRIEQGLTADEDIEEVYAEVEQLLGEPIDDEDENEVPLTDPTDVVRGDLQALIAEFVWEEKCEDGVEARVLGLLVRQLNEAPVPKVDLEYVEAKDLLRLLVHVFLGSAPAEREQAVRMTFGVLERFYAWAAETQEYQLGDGLTECRARLVDDVDRLARASRALSSADAPTTAQPILMRVQATRERELELELGAERRALIPLPDGVAKDLRVGDLVLGALRSGHRDDAATLDGMVVVVPEGCEAMLG